MSDRIITAGEVKMRCNFDTSCTTFDFTLRCEAAKLINLINGSAPPNNMTAEQNGEWNRIRAVAITNIQLGTLAAIEAENI